MPPSRHNTRDICHGWCHRRNDAIIAELLAIARVSLKRKQRKMEESCRCISRADPISAPKIDRSIGITQSERDDEFRATLSTNATDNDDKIISLAACANISRLVNSLLTSYSPYYGFASAPYCLEKQCDNWSRDNLVTIDLENRETNHSRRIANFPEIINSPLRVKSPEFYGAT